MEELKPCPFCGGKAEIKKHEEWGWFQYEVYCKNCDASFDASFSSKEAARNHWNRRVNDD